MKECGCYVKAILSKTDQVEIIYCPIHAAAPEMYEALKELEGQMALPFRAIKALAKAEGRA